MHHDSIVSKAKKIPSADLVDEHVYDESPLPLLEPPLPLLEPPGAEPSQEIEHGDASNHGGRKNDDGIHGDNDVSYGCDCDDSFKCDRDSDVSNHGDHNNDASNDDNNDGTINNHGDNDVSNQDSRDVESSYHVDGEARKQEGRGGYDIIFLTWVWGHWQCF